MPSDQQAMSRRQLLEHAGFGFGSLLLLPPAGQGERRTSFLRATTKADKGLAEFDVTIKAVVAAK